MKTYKLLTPGPLTTSESVKKEMLFDHCTWDNDYKNITQNIRRELLHIAHVSEEKYTVVLMQGSGTFGVESVLTSSIGENEKVLICTNGVYGNRMIDIVKKAGISHVVYEESYQQIVSAQEVEKRLQQDTTITHIAVVHNETTSGILNNIQAIGDVVKRYKKIFIVDGMSSFGGVDIPVEQWNIDFMISSANKCIQGVPGFSFIIARKMALLKCKNKAKSVSLDLFEQWENMEKDGKWRFTSPTHAVLAFDKAIEELKLEGGVIARNKRYMENNRMCIQLLKEIGMEPYIKEEDQGPIITTFFYPSPCYFTFEQMYHYLKERGYVIYPGKVTDQNTFRIGNIGEIYLEDIKNLGKIIKEFVEEYNHE